MRFVRPFWRVKNKSALLVAALAASHTQAAHELDGRDIANGETLYAEQCASCHGADLEGQPNWQTAGDDSVMPAPPHDETGHTWHHDNKLLFTYTKLGGEGAFEARGITGFKSGMPSFADVITDEEIWDILAFIQSSWPQRVKEIQAARNSLYH